MRATVCGSCCDMTPTLYELSMDLWGPLAGGWGWCGGERWEVRVVDLIGNIKVYGGLLPT